MSSYAITDATHSRETEALEVIEAIAAAEQVRAQRIEPRIRRLENALWDLGLGGRLPAGWASVGPDDPLGDEPLIEFEAITGRTLDALIRALEGAAAEHSPTASAPNPDQLTLPFGPGPATPEAPSDQRRPTTTARR